MNLAKHLILASVAGRGDEVRTALESFPGAYFQVAMETVDDPDDTNAVLERVVELYGEAVQQKKRRGEVAEASLAEARRSHLSIVNPQPPAAPAQSTGHHTRGAS